MKLSRPTILLAILFAVAGISGCAGGYGQYDYDFHPSDATGRWESSGNGPAVTLDLREDGTFTATGWPYGLYCDGAIPDADDDFEKLWENTVDYSGTWQLGEEGAEYVVWFLSVGSECRSNWGAVAWTVAGQPSRLRIDLSPLTPSEELADDQTLYLDKE